MLHSREDNISTVISLFKNIKQKYWKYKYCIRSMRPHANELDSGPLRLSAKSLGLNTLAYKPSTNVDHYLEF